MQSIENNIESGNISKINKANFDKDAVISEQQSLDGTKGGALDELPVTTTLGDNAQEEFNPKIALDSINNDPELKKFMVNKFEELKSLEKDRSALNDNMKAIRSTIEAKGIPVEAIKMAFKFYKMDLDVMNESIIGISFLMAATGQPVQIDFINDVPETGIH